MGLCETSRLYGQLRAKGWLNKGKEQGYWEDYNEDGTLFSKGYYINGSPSGNFKFYHENGILEEEGKFILGKKYLKLYLTKDPQAHLDIRKQ